MEGEVWKDIIGYEGLYEVSNMGRVKSLARMVYNGHVYFPTKDRILKDTLTHGYHTIALCTHGAKKTTYVHQLVAVTFLNHIPNGRKMDVDHINGDTTNNRVENLRIVTHRFNNTEGFRKDKDKLTSIYTGVSLHRVSNKWRSSIQINGKRKYLGYFANELDASTAYQNELSKLK